MILIVGAGLTGATVARVLTDHNIPCLVLDRLPYVGGHCADDVDATTGIPYHLGGPHYFRTSYPEVWQFCHRFTTFQQVDYYIRTRLGDNTYPWPLHRYTVEALAPGHEPPLAYLLTSDREPLSLQEYWLQYLPRPVYDLFIASYNLKQWGIPATDLLPRIGSRYTLRDDPHEKRAFVDRKWRGIPSNGYHEMVHKMLEGVPCVLGASYQQFMNKEDWSFDHMVYTGPIDEFYDYSLGRLEYRGQRRLHNPLLLPDGVDSYQGAVQVNNPLPSGGAHIRTTEWRWLLPPEKRATTRWTYVSREYPYSPDDPTRFEYPVPTVRNQHLYQQYLDHANNHDPDVTFCGRLGGYAYIDMDEAIYRALNIAKVMVDHYGTP